MVAIDDSFLPDDNLDAPEAGAELVDGNPMSWGAGAANPRGLRMRFRRTGPRTVESRYRIDPELEGWTGVAHGGAQAGMLDEAMAHAAWAHVGDDAGVMCVTTHLSVRYRRPVPVGAEVLVEAEVAADTGEELHIEARICAADREPLTVGTARWRKLPMTADAA